MDSLEPMDEDARLERKRSLADVISPLISDGSESKKRRKSKRRSSFVVGRRNAALPALPVSDLCKNIPTNLPPEERLQKLVKATCQYTLQKLEQEMNLQGMQQFTTEVMTDLEEKCKEVSFNKLLKSVTHKDSSSKPNPINIEIEKTAEDLQKRIEKYQNESDTWDGCLKNITEEADRSEDCVSRGNFVITEQPKTLSEKQLKLLEGRLDYPKMLHDLKITNETIDMQVTEIGNTVKLLNRISMAIENEISDINEKFVSELEDCMDLNQNPMSLLSNIINLD